MANYFSIMYTSLSLLVVMISLQTTATTSCTCQSAVGFGDCNKARVWKKHYYMDVGLYGDCLPTVPENTMRCFRWRLAGECGPDNKLKCSLRNRNNLNQPLETDSYRTEVTLRSPGFERKNPGYYNKNFCIYNISLDCPEEMVELIPTKLTTQLSSPANSCQDYLSFHIDSHRLPLTELCGEEVGDRSAYSTIPSSSFYGVLWSNNDGFEHGQYEIVAKCKDLNRPGSGDQNTSLTPN